MRLPDLINVKRVTVIPLEGGGSRDSLETIATNVKANVQQRDLQDVLRAGRKINSISYRVYTKRTEDINGDDVVEFEGNDYNIISFTPNPKRYIKLFIEKIVP